MWVVREQKTKKPKEDEEEGGAAKSGVCVCQHVCVWGGGGGRAHTQHVDLCVSQKWRRW